MKTTLFFSLLGFFVAAVMIASFAPITFAENQNRSDVSDFKEKLEKLENKIEQYEQIVAQEQPGEIILYQDPKTADFMAISTSSYRDYLKDEGLTASEIENHVAVWNEKSVETRKRLEETIKEKSFEAKKLREELIRNQKQSTPPRTLYRSAGAVVFDYDGGKAEADGRKATLHLEIDGKKAKGTMVADPVCETGIRLPRTKIDFEGQVTGPWEDRNSVITADWKGGDYGCNGKLMENFSKEGSLTIIIRPNRLSSEPEVFLKRTAGSSYGFVFKPLGKKTKIESDEPNESPWDISGVWTEPAHGTWTYTSEGDNAYKPKYEGKTISSTWTFIRQNKNNEYTLNYKGEVDCDGIGVARTQGNKVTIEIEYDVLKLRYELVLSKDGKKATGKWTSSTGESRDGIVLLKTDGGDSSPFMATAPPITLPPGFSTGAEPPAFASSYADRLRKSFTAGIINLKVGERYLQKMPRLANSRHAFDSEINGTGINSDPCVELPVMNIILTPTSLGTTSRVGSGVEIVAKNKGKGELWVRGRVRCKRPDGSRYEAQTITIYVVIVGGETAKELEKPGEVENAKVHGLAVMRDTGEPVSGALVTLFSDQLGTAQDPGWKTRADGSFSIVVKAGHGLNSGTYKVSIFKRNPSEIPGRCTQRAGTPPGIGIDCDQWPAQTYTVTLKKGASDIDVGTILMDFFRNIPSMHPSDP